MRKPWGWGIGHPGYVIQTKRIFHHEPQPLLRGAGALGGGLDHGRQVPGSVTLVCQVQPCALQLDRSVKVEQTNGTAVGVGVGGSISTRKSLVSPEALPILTSNQQPWMGDSMIRTHELARLRPSNR